MHNPMNEYFAWFGCTLAILSVIGPMLQTNYYFTGMISICIYFASFQISINFLHFQAMKVAF